MLHWFSWLSQGAATFLGTLTGSSIGLIAILIGALFNAHLNRKRDDRIRMDDTRAMAAALHAELFGLCESLERNAVELKKAKGNFVVPDISESIRILPVMLPKIGLLDQNTLDAVLTAYVVVEQYTGHLMLRGGHRLDESQNRKLILMTQETADAVVAMNESIAEVVRKALEKLKPYIQ